MKRVMVAVGLLALWAGPLWGQKGSVPQPPGPVFISGIVRDAQTRQPISFARVVLEADRAGYVAEINTDSQGRFRFEQLAHVVYTVRIKQPGYRGTSDTTNGCDPAACRRVDLSLQSVEYVEFGLVPLPSSDAGPNVPPGGPGATLNAQDAAIPEAARKEFEKATGLAQRGKTGDSIGHFKKAIELYPQFHQAYFGLGMAYMDEKDWKDAETSLTKATELNSGNPGAFLALGTAYAQEKNFAAAEKPLTHGLEMNPNVAEAQCELARTYLALGRWQEADPHAEKCATLKPELAPAHVYLGNIALKKHDNVSALKEFREYLRLEPQGLYAAGVRDVVGKLEKALGPQASAH